MCLILYRPYAERIKGFAIIIEDTKYAFINCNLNENERKKTLDMLSKDKNKFRFVGGICI